MKGDFSRRTHDPRKHYSAVLHEQGRLLTDADFDEEHRILSGVQRTSAADLIGGCGGPLDAAGFAVTSPDGVGLELSKGRYYVDGVLVTNERLTRYDGQPDRIIELVGWPPDPGRYAIYLDVWHRLVTARDDPSIREVALGGPTTAAREQTVWQARHAAVDATWTCASGLPAASTTTGRMAARATPDLAAPSPCLVPPLAGYTGLENQLYRVEVLVPGAATDLAGAGALTVLSFPDGTVDQVRLAAADAATLTAGDVVELVATGAGSDPLEATFAQVAAVDADVVTLTGRVPAFGPGDDPVLRPAAAAVVVSRENGSVATTIERIDGAEVTVADLGPDDVLGFAPGQWVELTDDAVELEGLTRHLRRVEAIDTDRRMITLGGPAPALSTLAGGIDPARHPKLRRWDAARAIVFRADGTGWLHLEHGIAVRFTAGQYVSGDHWGFPARAAVVDPASGTIEWPQEGGGPAELRPAGVAHRYCPLAVVEVAAGPVVTVVDDCRHLFPPVTALTNLLYVGGDGQEARRGDPAFPTLPAPLVVRVANGGRPVPGATVAFRPELVGSVTPTDPVTDADGLVRASWTLHPGVPSQTCTARLLDAAGAEIAHQVVEFHATVQEMPGGGGCCVSIGPDGDFPSLDVAINHLVARGQRDLCLCLLPGDHVAVAVVLVVGPQDPPHHLSIHGCGRGTRLRIEKGWFVEELASLHVADLDLHLAPGLSMTMRAVDEVELDGVRVSGLPSGDALVRIHDAERVTVHGCELRGRSADADGRLAALLAGLPVLEQVWTLPEDAFDEGLRRGAVQLAELSAGDRIPIGEKVIQIAGDGRRHLPAGLSAALARLGALLRVDPLPTDPLPELRGVPAAAAAQFPQVLLEIGARDEFQGAMAEPGLVRPARITVTDNVIHGDLSFYGRHTGNVLTPDERTALGDYVKPGQLVPGMAGTVHLHGNRLSRLLLSGGITDALRLLGVPPGRLPLQTLYEAFHMADNVLDGIGGDVLARHATLTGNEFTIDGVSNPLAPLVVMGLIADSAVSTGNHGRLIRDPAGAAVPVRVATVTRTFAQAANLEITFN